VRRLSLVFLTFAALPALAADQAQQLLQPGATLQLSLKQAVAIALAPEGNTQVQLAGEATRQAQARSAESRAALLPSFDSYVSEQSETENLASFGLHFQIPIPGFVFPSFVGPFQVFDARIQATQSIFDFSSIRRFQASRTGIKTSAADKENAANLTTAQVAQFYMAALAAQAHVEAAQANLDLTEANEKLADNRKNAGTGTGIEVTRALVEVADARQKLLVAQNDQRQARLQLLRALGVRLETQVELTDKLTYTPVPDAPIEPTITSALAARPDLKAQKTREDSARLNYSATKFERLPSVSAFGNYGSIGTGINNAVPTRTYGVTMRLPLFDGGRRDARRSESQSEFRQEQIRTSDLRQQVELDIRLALDSLHSAEDQLKVAAEGIEQAEREVAQAQRRYDAGVANSLEPIDAQTRLARARDNRISALLAYNIARINLGQATGTIRRVIQ
jgi:outer membrane protein